MSISGLAIFKLLPGGQKGANANCKKCGFPTCMAYAMKLAKNNAKLEDCPYVSEELTALLEAQGGKKQEEVSFGLLSNPIKVGGETVLYRHDKAFINPTCLSVRFKTSKGVTYCEDILNKIINYEVERVGEVMTINSITLHNDNNNSETFNKLLNLIIEKTATTEKALILVSESIKDLTDAALSLKKLQKPLLYLLNATKDEYINLYQNTNCPICIDIQNSDDPIQLLTELEKEKITQLVLSIPGIKKEDILEVLTLMRRSIIINNQKTLRFPVLTFASDYCSDSDKVEEGLWAGNLMCKYSNLIILDNFDPAIIYSLYTLRQNLFTDPQKPLQIEPKLYSIGEVNEYSPVIVTTNFALTYFSVAGEIEASNIPTYLLITSSDGMSVLTAWAANKFSGEIIAKAVKEANLEEKVAHKNLIISGYVSMLKEEIEEELPDWQIHIAPLEAVDIPDYLKKYVAN